MLYKTNKIMRELCPRTKGFEPIRLLFHAGRTFRDSYIRFKGSNKELKFVHEVDIKFEHITGDREALSDFVGYDVRDNGVNVLYANFKMLKYDNGEPGGFLVERTFTGPIIPTDIEILIDSSEYEALETFMNDKLAKHV